MAYLLPKYVVSPSLFCVWIVFLLFSGFWSYFGWKYLWMRYHGRSQEGWREKDLKNWYKSDGIWSWWDVQKQGIHTLKPMQEFWIIEHNEWTQRNTRLCVCKGFGIQKPNAYSLRMESAKVTSPHSFHITHPHSSSTHKLKLSNPAHVLSIRACAHVCVAPFSILLLSVHILKSSQSHIRTY